jgi:ABC-2 type transport system ATP-binding protein
MKMLLGLVKPDVGKLQVCGLDVVNQTLEVKKIVGYVPESLRLYEFLTGLEYLDFIADVHGVDFQTKKTRIKSFLEAFDLEGREYEMISGYSRGMKQKIAIIAALVHQPKLLILDEPLSGLDPRSARIMKDLMHQLAAEGVTILMSTHILEIAEATCDRIYILSQGQKLAEGTAHELRERAQLLESSLEDVFLTLTGTNDMQAIVKALVK